MFSASTMQKLQARLGRTIEPSPRPAPTAVSTAVPPPPPLAPLHAHSSSSAAAAAVYGRGGAPPSGGSISAAVVPVHPLHAAASHHGSYMSPFLSPHLTNHCIPIVMFHVHIVLALEHDLPSFPTV